MFFWLFKMSCGFPVPVAAFLVAFVFQRNRETYGGEGFSEKAFKGFSEEAFKLACKLLGGRVFKSRVNYTLRRANYIFWRPRFDLVQSRKSAFHLSLNMISSETHAAIAEVIESCKQPF